MLTRATRLLALTLVLPLAAACADMGEEEMGGEAADTAATTTPMQGETMGETFDLQGVNDSGISGEIESETRGDSIFLNVTMEGAPGSDLPAHVHSGSCDQMQAPVAAQVSLQWGMSGETMESGTSDEQPSAGTGEAAMTDDQQTHVRVGVATMDLMGSEGDHSLRFHGSGGEVIACADLPDDLTGSAMPSEGTGAGTTEGR